MFQKKAKGKDRRQDIEDQDVIVMLTDSGEQQPQLPPPPIARPLPPAGNGVASLVYVSNIQPGRVGLPCAFKVDAVRAGTGGLEIVVSAAGRSIPNFVKTLTRGLYEVSFTPQSLDPHIVEITFNGANIAGSPFVVPVQYELTASLPSVADVASIIISPIRGDIVGKLVTFQVDASRAGRGALSVEVFGHRSHPIVRMTPGSMRGIYEASFVPEEGGIHNVDASFNGQRIPGCPLKHTVINPREVVVRWDGLQAASVQTPVTFNISVPAATSFDDIPLEAMVTDASGQRIPVQLNRAGNYGMTATFVPVRVGKMTIAVLACGEHVVGSPFASFAYDASAVRIENVSQPGIVGREMCFTVDLTQAGKGNVEVFVTCLGLQVQTFCQFIDDNHQKFSFVPIRAADHFVTVNFNKLSVMSSALVLKVIDINGASMTGFVPPSMPTQQMLYPSIYPSQGASFDPNMVIAVVTAPNGTRIQARVLQQPNGDYKVDYNSPFTGSHRVDITYNGQPLRGSPFVVDIFDPSKIRVNGATSGTVRQLVQFDVIQTEAGPAKLAATCTGPSGRTVPVTMTTIPAGTRCSYTPVEPGAHAIVLTYGGLNVPGMPLTHTIVGDGQTVVPAGHGTHVTNVVTAIGDGLRVAAVKHLTKFMFSRVGQPEGRLHVHVDAPHSVLACQVVPDTGTDGLYAVTYTPLEVGVHKVIIRWNGMDLEGSPYVVRVVDPLQVKPVGGWEAVLNSSGVLQLAINELIEIPFNTRDAGDGELSATILDPHGSKVNVMVLRSPDNNSQTIRFTPRIEGEYKFSASYSTFELVRDPILCVASATGQSDKVTVSGLLANRDFFANEQVEFDIDGRQGGRGEPKVKVHGIQADAEAYITQVETSRYRCSFTPPESGLYLVTVMWGDKQVPGSPFKVNVHARGDPSKVTFKLRDGSTTAVVGMERAWIVDKRSAGNGHLSATCAGPLGPVLCDLKPTSEGLHVLAINMEDIGVYTLTILFDGQHVPGSPYVFDAQAQGDPNKVTVCGPGVLDGVLAIYSSDFNVNTSEAGLGQLTVRIRGPKGAFRVELKRDKPTDRIIKCHYCPTEVGLYSIDVQWSGVSVPGSPFPVNIFDTLEELNKFYRRYPERRPKLNEYSSSAASVYAGFNNYSGGSTAVKVFED